MAQKRNPRKALILERDESVSSRLESILTEGGWHVRRVTDSPNAVKQMQQAANEPFALFVCGASFSIDAKEDVLEKAEKLSPMTQRMLMVALNKPDIIVSAINKSEINACITYSYQNQEFLEQANTCLKQFLHKIKEQQLKRIAVHQNRKMFQIAKTLKKKEEMILEGISEKKAERLMLKSRLRQREKQASTSRALTLADRFDKLDIEISPESFGKEFLRMDGFIRGILNSIAGKTGRDSVKRLTEQVPVSHEWDGIVDNILKAVYLSDATAWEGLPGEEEAEERPKEQIDQVVSASIDPDLVTAYIEKISEPTHSETLTLNTLLNYLKDQNITYGLVADDVLESWIKTSEPGDGKRIVALGDSPKQGHSGEVSFFFEIEYTNPGKIAEDGSIDFRDRGDIPYVNQDERLAEKKPAKEGKPGISVSGEPIPQVEVADPLFGAGEGARLSEDELSILADRSGQPHVDMMGTVTVNSELVINGDVDFKTGNINFNGNIRVTGTIKDGFHVKGIHLTAKEIKGGIIDVKGDVCVSYGITGAKISAQGNVYAKYINSSIIRTFGDVVVQREILDSRLDAGGSCQNTNGRITASRISAKTGIEAGHIGTDTSNPATLKVGVDVHAQILLKEIDRNIEASVSELSDLRENIKKLEQKDQALYEQISQHGQHQDIAQSRLAKAKAELSKLGQGDPLARSALTRQIRDLAEEAAAAEAALDKVFETQDRYASKSDEWRDRIEYLEQENKKKVLEKKAIREYSDRKEARARVIVRGRITQGTEVQGPNQNLTMLEGRSRCQVVEQLINEDGLVFHDMKITDIQAR